MCCVSAGLFDNEKVYDKKVIPAAVTGATSIPSSVIRECLPLWLSSRGDTRIFKGKGLDLRRTEEGSWSPPHPYVTTQMRSTHIAYRQGAPAWTHGHTDASVPELCWPHLFCRHSDLRAHRI